MLWPHVFLARRSVGNLVEFSLERRPEWRNDTHNDVFTNFVVRHSVDGPHNLHDAILFDLLCLKLG